jgi:hypothetical protein
LGLGRNEDDPGQEAKDVPFALGNMLNGSMSAQPATLEEIADLLASARDATSQLTPGADSPAEHELTAPAHPDYAPKTAVERLIASVELWTVIASDQLYGLSTILRDGESAFGIFPLLRSVLEHSALVAWSLDDEATPRIRAARASLSALRSAHDLHKAASYMGGKGSETQQAAKARMKQLKVDVGTEFGSLQLDPLELEGESVATPTVTLRHFGERWGNPREWEGIYDYLCSTGTHPSLGGFEYFGRTGIEIKPDTLNRLLRSAIVPYIKALEYFCSYMDWSNEPIDAFIDRVNAVLGPTMRTPEASDPAAI